ncbi:hypothetical protein [Aureliella helgolandensis]|uniref:Uncharacterized protein n=1 Tax=Aureliella helgolandensis TaxID=2527968 RepID=A0A518GDN2_9BACT|nr:hypothetical protein [Aureliella helgolandensis]QDV26715.1 hypothetical protein Q31a_50940 [Aureliella helgolandensis]
MQAAETIEPLGTVPLSSLPIVRAYALLRGETEGRWLTPEQIAEIGHVCGEIRQLGETWCATCERWWAIVARIDTEGELGRC